MDFDIGNFLYILLMLVFIILGSLGKKKKPATPPMNDQEPENIPVTGDIPADIFEENIRKFFTGEDEKIILEEETYQESVISPPEPVMESPVNPYGMYSGAMNVASKEEGLSSTFGNTDKLIEMRGRPGELEMKRSTSFQSNFVVRALKDFNPKKAILYKEIFDPKYF